VRATACPCVRGWPKGGSSRSEKEIGRQKRAYVMLTGILRSEHTRFCPFMGPEANRAVGALAAPALEHAVSDQPHAPDSLGRLADVRSVVGV
jgi:hypothetical protein